MKNNKKHITKLFYKFLVDNGILFHVLERLGTTKYPTLEKHCEACKVTKYVINIWSFGTGGNLSYSQYTDFDYLWKRHITKYLNNKNENQGN